MSFHSTDKRVHVRLCVLIEACGLYFFHICVVMSLHFTDLCVHVCFFGGVKAIVVAQVIRLEEKQKKITKQTFIAFCAHWYVNVLSKVIKTVFFNTEKRVISFDRLEQWNCSFGDLCHKKLQVCLVGLPGTTRIF